MFEGLSLSVALDEQMSLLRDALDALPSDMTATGGDIRTSYDLLRQTMANVVAALETN